MSPDTQTPEQLRQEVEQLLAGITPDDEYVKRVRYELGGGRMYRAVPGARGEDRTLIIDTYQECDRELYFNAPRLIRSLLAQLQAAEDRIARVQEYAQHKAECRYGEMTAPLCELNHWMRPNKERSSWLCDDLAHDFVQFVAWQAGDQSEVCTCGLATALRVGQEEGRTGQEPELFRARNQSAQPERHGDRDETPTR